MYDHVGIDLIIMAMKMSSHCCVVIVFDVKDVTFESVQNSIFSLSYIFDVAPIAFQTIYRIVALACAISYCIVDCIIMQVFYFP